MSWTLMYSWARLFKFVAFIFFVIFGHLVHVSELKVYSLALSNFNLFLMDASGYECRAFFSE